MATSIKLVRSEADDFVQVPKAVQAGDYVFTSSIYPVDTAGHAICIDPLLGEIGPSVMEVQTRRCLETLKSILSEFGSSLELVLKVDVNIADAQEFLEFNNVWKEYFPKYLPARTTVEVGDTLPFHGARLSLEAVALSGDSKLLPVSLDDPGGSDPRDIEGASHAIRAGNLIFCSAFPANDFEKGLAVSRAPKHKNYGGEAEMQAEYILARLNRVLAQENTSVEQSVEAQLYLADISAFHDVDAVWGKYMPVPPPRSAMGVAGLILPGALCAANLIIVVPDSEHIKQQSQKGFGWHPIGRRHYSPAIKAGPWRFFAGVVPSPDFENVVTVPEGLRRHRSEIEEQTRYTMKLLTEQLEANETNWTHCHHVRVYLTDPRRDYRGFMRVWREWFPNANEAPALGLVPSTATMIQGPLIEIDPTCVTFN